MEKLEDQLRKEYAEEHKNDKETPAIRSLFDFE
jgi:hypothetical protein